MPNNEYSKAIRLREWRRCYDRVANRLPREFYYLSHAELVAVCPPNEETAIIAEMIEAREI